VTDNVPGTRVGWVGLGAMGSPMAGCLARAGFAVTAYDIDPARAEALAGDGVAPATSIADAAAGSDVLGVMVATPDQVESVLFGDDPAADALPPGAVVVVMATVGPAPVRQWAQRLGEKQVDLVDAPVSGGAVRAGAGDLLIMVGGTASAVDRVRPLLDAMARTAPHVGTAPGDGQKVKLVNQLLCGVHIAAAAEALAFAETLDLDPAATWEVLRGGAAASFMLDDRGARMLDEAWTPAHSALDIFVKDLGLVDEAARAVDYEAPLTRAAHALFVRGSEQGLGREDDSGLLRVLRGDGSGT
jgi:3-hydroxyisobutyrate dehydrogenase